MAVDRRAVLPVPDAVRATLRRPVGWATWLPHLALAVAFLAGASLPTTWRYVPLVASVVVFGLPHGATDWVALPRAVAGRATPRLVGVVVALYVVAGGAYAAVWLVAPGVAALGFVALTWAHWGQGDIYPLVAVFGADHLSVRWARALTAAVRGGLPMVVPLLAFPERYRTVLSAFAAAFGGTAPAWPFDPAVRLALGLGFGTLTLVALSVGYRRADDRGPWLVDAGETALLWGYFWTVPPVLAVGVYFCLWHSLRHVVRVVALDAGASRSLARGALLPGFARFARDAALPTAGALAVCGALWWLAPSPSATVRGVVAVYLVGVAVLTLPHVAVVTWIDREQGLL